MRAWILSLCVAGVLLTASEKAEAAAFRLGLGASYWFVEQGEFDVTLDVTTPIYKKLSVGGRFGVALVTGEPTVGIPLDLQLRLDLGRIYTEVYGGPWVFFGSGDNLAGHVSFGVGLNAGALSVGAEVGYLEPNAILGLKLAYRL